MDTLALVGVGMFLVAVLFVLVRCQEAVRVSGPACGPVDGPASRDGDVER
jgi:hypothetical protein